MYILKEKSFCFHALTLSDTVSSAGFAGDSRINGTSSVTGSSWFSDCSFDSPPRASFAVSSSAISEVFPVSSATSPLRDSDGVS